jgi:acetyl esterase/lipase
MGWLREVLEANPALSAGVTTQRIEFFRQPDAVPWLRQELTKVVGSADDDALLALSPIHHVSTGAPPILTVTGDQDVLTPLGTIEAFTQSWVVVAS